MNKPWEENFYPEWIWFLAANVILLAGVVAAAILLWHHGPALLIKYGPQLFTRWGTAWDDKRTNGGSDDEAT